MKENTKNIPPAQLWHGNHTLVTHHVEEYLQNIFCTKNGCRTCYCCAQIAQHQHHEIMWINPEKGYTLATLEPIFATSAFTLEQNRPYFFILEKTEFLTTACANSLLKLLEEPPTGYHFILLTQRKDALIQTLQSRCVLKEIIGEAGKASHELLTCFLSAELVDPLTFMQILEKNKSTEFETVELFDIICTHWLKEYSKKAKKTDTAEKKFTSAMVELCLEARKKTPLSGSSALFWKNLFMLASSAKKSAYN